MKTSAAPARTSLDRATIVQAALDLLEEAGIEGMSTRRLAAALGVKGPSLYWHFKNKGELLAHMSGAMFAEALPEPDLESANFDWEDWLARGARGIRKVALSRRDGALVMARARPVMSEEGREYEQMARTLERSGLSEEDARLTLLALGRYAMGWVLFEQAAERRTIAGGDDGFEFGLQTFLAGVRARVAAANKG